MVKEQIAGINKLSQKQIQETQERLEENPQRSAHQLLLAQRLENYEKLMRISKAHVELRCEVHKFLLSYKGFDSSVADNDAVAVLTKAYEKCMSNY